MDDIDIPPLTIPYDSIASFIYVEQEGVYRQFRPNNGDKNHL